MKKRMKDQGYRMGRLPASAPLANAYVPFQEEGAPKYDTGKALVRGTLFPGLDLPFMGSVNRNEKPVTPMTQLQMLAFAVQELALYLDTHRDDREALELYRNYQKLYARYREEYETLMGPMNHRQVMDGDGYRWLDDPWPWEYSRNKEV